MKTNLEQVLFPDLLVILTLFKNKNYESLSQLHEEIKITYAHIVKIKNLLIEKGYAKEVKIGRKVKIITTEKGQLVSENFTKLLDSMGVSLINKQGGIINVNNKNN